MTKKRKISIQRDGEHTEQRSIYSKLAVSYPLFIPLFSLFKLTSNGTQLKKIHIF